MKPFHFWADYGKHLFPFLSKVALRVLSIPTSSAASKRVWSIFAFNHSKNRNRLSVERADKLVFMDCNAVLLDNTDHNDFSRILSLCKINSLQTLLFSSRP